MVRQAIRVPVEGTGTSGELVFSGGGWVSGIMKLRNTCQCNVFER